MDTDQVWDTIDEQRAQAADLLDTLSEKQWDTPSLCDGWRVRDVAAHLTLAHTGVGAAFVGIVRSGGSFNGMIRDGAIRAATQPADSYSAWLRSVAGSRRKVLGLSPLEPMIDILVHQQDIARPLGMQVPTPVSPAAAAAQRAYSMGFPFRAQRRLGGLQLRATDTDWTAGDGALVRAPVAELLMLVTGRAPDPELLDGPGAERVRQIVGGAPG